MNYNNLRVSRRARSVIGLTYSFTRSLPRDEMLGLTAQMRRAALSSGLNIVEGCSRSSTRELIRFLQMSVGSAMELEFALLITHDLGLGSREGRLQLWRSNKILQRETSALIRTLRLRLARRSRS
jgi:four helix bundle protein